MQFSGNTSTLNVEISDKSGIAVPTAVNYIKSGEKEIENAVNEGITQFNTNATAKTTAYNQNATEKTTAYNENATAKLSAYNENDEAKTTAYNQNATEKTTAFNANATSKTADFNTNAGDKTTAFDNNASAKTTAFNTNATEKQAAVDASATAAAASASTSKQWAVGEPTEPTGNSSKYWAQSAAASASNMANRDLSNLSSDGQMIVDSVNGTISNCVLEIPQNIKLTLENNVLTLKAGSIITITGGTYTTVTTTQDVTVTISTNDTFVVFPRRNGAAIGGWIKLSRIGSGSPLPADGTTYTCFFNTTDKLIYLWSNNEWIEWNVGYPLCVVKVENGNMSFVKDSNGNDMIFNGCGFIGRHRFVYPNVKCLFAAGKDSNGKLLSEIITTAGLLIAGNNAVDRSIFYLFSERTANAIGPNAYYYSEAENLWRRTSNNEILHVCVLATTTGNVSSMTIRQPVRTATVEMLDTLQDQVDTNTTAISGKQDTLVSGTNIKTINSTFVLGSGNFTLADQSLSNLDSTGQMVVDSQNGTISNCILDIPQNLKLEFSNGTVTLKAGSVIVLTGGTYSTVTTTQDVTWNSSTQANTKQYLFITKYGFAGGLYGRSNLNKAGSGPNLPVDSSTYLTFFNTTDKIIYQWNPDTSQWESTTLCYPLGIIEIDSQGNITGFAKDSNGNDMIFNGAGFIGHHAFVYPNVSGLVPYGINSDGTLKSFYQKLASLYIIDMDSSWQGTDYQPYTWISLNSFSGKVGVSVLSDIEYEFPYDMPATGSLRNYVKSRNLYMNQNGIGGFNDLTVVKFIKYAYDGTTVTDFTIRQPVRMATVEMLKDKQNKLTFDTAPTSNSTNPVTSGGVYTALAAKADDNAVVHLAEDETITGNKTFSGTNTFVTPAVSDSSQKPATTAYINNKFQVVSALPASPDADTFYFIPES